MRSDVEFDADGVTLRGWLYTPDGAAGPAPTIVMAHGFSAVKEMYLDRFAEAFAAAGLGALVYDNRTAAFVFRNGPVFTNLLLADEINRTPPKTQAALLEAMEERQVSVDGEPRPLPEPFWKL